MSTFQNLNYVKKLYHSIINSIAFYPTLLSLAGLFLAWLCLYIDAISYGGQVISFLSFLVVKNTETARSILSVLAGGLISLMVFSFSMVMIVLNQTASSYSPRVLPGLVSRPEHQLVLGLYLGTIGFTLAVLSNVHSETFEVLVPRFSIIVNLVLGLGCFAAFIYFIHDISTTIQVGNILKRLYYKTRSSLIRELSGGCYKQEVAEPEIKELVKAWQSGYFFSVMEKPFIEKAEEEQLQVKILINQGEYILKGEPFLEVNQAITEKVQGLLMSTFIFRHQEMIEDNFIYGYKQITEVALKALSPGINDPGTALQAIDYLSDLFMMLLNLKGRRVLLNKKGAASLIYLPVPFMQIFYFSIASLRIYAGKDIVVQAKLIALVKRMAGSDMEKGNKIHYLSELEAIEEIAKKSLNSQKDVDYIRNLLR